MKHAVALFCVLIVLCSGCSHKQTFAPTVLKLSDCPAPSVPVMPDLNAEEPLDGPENVARLLERDDLLRNYINGLNAALRCYQARGNHGK